VEEKKEFNATKYKNEYQKEHYKRKTILLKTEELKKVNKVLNSKKQTLKNYVMEKVNEDLNK
jgi:hypothetical protein